MSKQFEAPQHPHNDHGPSQEVTLSTGVVVRLKAVSPFVINSALDGLKKPKVPRQFIEGKGREEENPMHPDYLEALEVYAQERGRVSQDAMMLLGVEVESLPAGFPSMEDDDWVENMELLGVEVHREGKRRRLDWLRYVAMQTVADLETVSTVISRLSGVPETEVQKAVESFRGDQEQRADSGASAAPARPDGN